VANCRAWRTTLRGALFSGLYALAACSEFGDIKYQSVQYNIAADQANNEELLLNILRVGHERPAEWSNIRLVQGQVTESGILGLILPFDRRTRPPVSRESQVAHKLHC